MARARTSAPTTALLCLALLSAGGRRAAAAALLPAGGACPEGYRVCMDGDGCVPSEAFCDGSRDCNDGSDELPFRCGEHTAASEAPAARDTEALEPLAAGAAEEAAAGEVPQEVPEGTCLDSEHRCLDGTCISRARMCDSTRDCHDGSDEDALAGCAPSSGNATLEVEWLPGAGAGEGVDHLPQRRLCDEQLEFTCGDGSCIARNLTCDLRRDCPDGSDETMACPAPLAECHEDFRCADGLCLPKDWVCDGHPDCRDSSDEGAHLCANWQKRHQPAPTPARPAADDVARDGGDPCERMEPAERQRCREAQLHEMKAEELRLRQRAAREQLEQLQAAAAAAKELRQEQLQAAQLASQAAQELLQQQRALHALRLQTLRHAAAEVLAESLSAAAGGEQTSTTAPPAAEAAETENLAASD